jgi:hypothetical protein
MREGLYTQIKSPSLSGEGDLGGEADFKRRGREMLSKNPLRSEEDFW